MSFLTLVTQTSPNTSLGFGSLVNAIASNATGNVAIGPSAGAQITTGDFNTALGNNALTLNQTGNQNTAVGGSAMSGSVNAFDNVAIGYQALSQIGGNANTAIGAYAGSAISTGAKNSILGGYTGNQGGLDIRTLSNYIVLSDGDGNPRLWIDNTGAATIPGGVVFSGGTANGVLYLNGSKVATSGSNLTFDGAVLSTGGAAGNGRVYVTNSVGGYSLALMGASKAIRVEHTATQSNISGVDSSLVGSYEPIMLNGSIVLLGINGSERMRLDSSGNLGLGVTPSAWGGSGIRAFEVGNTASVYRDTVADAYIGYNHYLNSALNAVYSNNGFASRYRQGSGIHAWFNAPSGTAGNAITFTQAMTLDASGNLMLGTTSPSGRFIVNQDQNALTDITIQNSNLGANAGVRLVLGSAGGASDIQSRRSGGTTVITTSAIDRLTFDQNGNVVVGAAAIATNATNGFLYVPTCAGTPTGTPTTYTGRSPIVVDSTNNKLYFYSGGSWRDAGP